MESESMLMAVTAEVLMHDGTNWIHLDNINSTQNMQALSTIQLVKIKQEFRIVALRRMDNKRIIDQGIFNRLKYKEATPSFHQWRNEQKQVIGLSFPNEQDAKNFYLAVKNALDSVMNINLTSTQKSQVDTATYQSPQNFNNYVQQHDIYYNHDNSEGLKMHDGYIENFNQRNNCICSPNVIMNQQQNLIRRASQGSNISSSTSGSMPGPVCGQSLVNPQTNCNSHEATNSVYATSCISERNNTNIHNQNQSVAVAKAQISNAPPPPPPPPPDLKNLISSTKQQSFADQLKHVQLRKNSIVTSETTSNVNKAFKAQSSIANPSMESNIHLNGVSSCGKLQNGSQDLISELSDRLNKRKINAESGNTNHSQMKSPAQQNVSDISKKNVSAETSQKKNPSVSSLSSQDDTNNSINNTTNIDQQNGSNRKSITPADLDRLKAELKESFSEELSKLKIEMTQTICNEIAKLINKK